MRWLTPSSWILRCDAAIAHRGLPPQLTPLSIANTNSNTVCATCCQWECYALICGGTVVQQVTERSHCAVAGRHSRSLLGECVQRFHWQRQCDKCGVINWLQQHRVSIKTQRQQWAARPMNNIPYNWPTNNKHIRREYT
ncbi:hypothetical protein ACLKA6_015436 [Drosophila palustris]